jgi:hypothetical protein
MTSDKKKPTYLDTLKENYNAVCRGWTVGVTIGAKRTNAKITLDTVDGNSRAVNSFFADMPRDYHWLLRTAEEKTRLEARVKELEAELAKRSSSATGPRLRTRKPDRVGAGASL